MTHLVLVDKISHCGMQGRPHAISRHPGNRSGEEGTVFTGKHSIVHGGHSPFTAGQPATQNGPLATQRGTHWLQQVGLKPFCWEKGESHFTLC